MWLFRARALVGERNEPEPCNLEKISSDQRLKSIHSCDQDDTYREERVGSLSSSVHGGRGTADGSRLFVVCDDGGTRRDYRLSGSR